MKIRMLCVVFLSALIGLGVLGEAWGIEVPLTVSERAGVPRVGNHVNSGVPLPVGAVKDVGELALFTADGQPVLAQIAERCRWLKDDSLKFVTVHFACDVPADGSAKYVLKSARVAPAKTIKVIPEGEAVTVDTGPLKFVVRKGDFNLFEQVWLDGTEVVAPGSASIKLVATEGEYVVVNKRASVANESDPFSATPVAETLEIEEAGPVRVVVKVTGTFMKGEEKTLDFVARIYTLAGSPSVRVAFTVINRVGTKFESFIGIKELSLAIPLKVSSGKRNYAFGAVGDPDHKGTLAPGEKATLLQLTSTEYTVNGEKYPGGRDGLSRRLGWVDLTGGDVGLAVGVRYFWQLYPKGLQVSGDGSVKVMLVAPGGERPPMFTGGARTHEILFAFHKADASGRARVMSVVAPLFAAAPTEWYCQETRAFGQFYDQTLDNFKPEYHQVIQAFQNNVDGRLSNILSKRDGVRQGIEEYGFFSFGAGVHHSSLVVEGKWLETAWNGNYYDYPFAVMVNFIRTGNLRCWDVAQQHGLHLADIDVCHWHPKNQKLNGIEHVCYNIGHFRQFWSGYKFGVSGNADSTKNQSLYHLYYMTGDRWYLDVALMVSDYNAIHGGGALRAVGNRMTGLFGAYETTHDPAHFERWKDFVLKRGVGRALSRGLGKWDQGWMYGLAAEGLMTYYRTTGDLEAAQAVVTCCDSLIKNFWQGPAEGTSSGTRGFTVICFGYAYELTGDESYLIKGLQQLKLTAEAGAGSTKTFAQQFRLSPQFLYYLTGAYQPPKPVIDKQ